MFSVARLGLEVTTQQGCTICTAEKQIMSATQLVRVLLNFSFSPITQVIPNETEVEQRGQLPGTNYLM